MEIYPTKHLRFTIEAKDIDINRLIANTNKLLNIEAQVYDAEKYYNVDIDYDLDATDAKIYILDHNTTQGVVIGRAENGKMQLVIPEMSSDMDVSVAFGLLRAMQELCPTLSIQTPDAITDISAEGEAEAIKYCHSNMRNYLITDADGYDWEWGYTLRGYRMGFCISLDMLKKQHRLDGDDVDTDVLVDLALDTFCRVQCSAMTLPHAEHTVMNARCPLHYYDEDGNRDDDEGVEDIVIILNDNLFVNISWSEIVLWVNGQYKFVSKDAFYEAALAHSYIEVFSEEQYAISKMTDKEWEEFCKSMPGEIVAAPKVFILRWNPAISSLSRKRYCHCLEKYGENWGVNWAIYDWHQAKKGDLSYMLLEGPADENPGIIFKGMFRCNPYTDKDWRGSDKELHYVDVECWNMADINKCAWLDPQQLEEAIPDFNWRSGRSGELLSAKQAEALERLWNKARTKIYGNRYE